MNNTLVIEAKNLTKTFSSKEVIKNCNLNVKEGTIYGFLGANGAGKTTVFKLLSGLIKPTMGSVQILGMDIVSQRESILSKIGTLIETPVFYEHLSATENLELHLEYMNKKHCDIADVLTKVGLNDTGTQPVSTFSLGMRQRLAIARAMIHNPQLLILDEPINGLDPMGIRQMRDLFMELVREHGMTILVSSHILTEIEQIADTIGVIVDGTIVKEVPMAQIKAEYPSGLEDYFMNIMIGSNENEKIY